MVSTLRRVRTEGPKRNQKVLAPSYGLRCAQVPSLRTCSVGTPPRAIHGPVAALPVSMPVDPLLSTSSRPPGRAGRSKTLRPEAADRPACSVRVYCAISVDTLLQARSHSCSVPVAAAFVPRQLQGQLPHPSNSLTLTDDVQGPAPSDYRDYFQPVCEGPRAWALLSCHRLCNAAPSS